MSFQVIILNDFAHINGGASKVALLTALSLAEKEYSVTIFSAVPPVAKELQNGKVRVVCTNQKDILSNPNRLSAVFQGLWNFKSAELFSKILDKYDPSRTIIHVHSWTKALSSSVINIGLKKRFKLLCTIHDYFFACPNGGFFNYHDNKPCNYIPMSFRCIITNCDMRNYYHKLWRLSRQVIQRYLGHIPNSIKHFIVVSNYCRSIIKSFLPPDAKIYMISNPVNVIKEEPVQAHKNKVFVYIGRLSREKGVLLFAEAAALLGIDVLFIGDGYLKNEIIRICPQAKITGWLTSCEMKNLLRMSRTLVFPSLCYETQGMAVLEANAMGIPVIVSDGCAAKDYVKDGLTGLLFKSGNLENLVEKIKMCFNDQFVRDMAKNSYEHYWSNPCTMENYIKMLESCYISVINS